jgi:hypothetical protein
VKFPKKLRHRGKGKVLATIYRLPDGYRLYWRARVLGVDGKLKPKSRMRLFKRYADAKREGDRMVADLAKGTSTALSPGQAADAQNAIEELQRYFQATLASAFQSGMPWASSARLGERPLSEAVDGFLSNVATVKRVELNEAVEQFVESRKLRTVAKDGRCPQLSPSWHYIVAMWLREFAKSFPGHAVCDLSREHLNAYVNGHGDLSPRTRNGRSNVVKMFLKWAVERDYLAANHRLLVADGMTKEVEDLGDVEFHTPKELRTLLESCQRAEFRSLLSRDRTGRVGRSAIAGNRTAGLAGRVARAGAYRSHPFKIRLADDEEQNLFGKPVAENGGDDDVCVNDHPHLPAR